MPLALGCFVDDKVHLGTKEQGAIVPYNQQVAELLAADQDRT